MDLTFTAILQLVTLVTLVSGFFLWSIRQKNATIESARQQTETIKQQMELMRAEFESVAARALDERVSIMEREIERIREDNKNLSDKLDQIAKRKKKYADKRAEKFEPILDELYEIHGRDTPRFVLRERTQEVWEEWYDEFREEIEAEEARRSGEADDD